jgi:hypothetical protein
MNQVFLKDFFDIFFVDVGVPDPIRIDDRHRSFLTTPETPGDINPAFAWSGDAELLAAFFGIFSDGFGIATGATLLAFFAFIGADKQVTLIVAHPVIISAMTQR